MMLIVDAQVHLWANNLPANPGHRQIPDFTADDLLKEMDESGIDAAIIHPPGWDPGSDDLALEAARLHPNRLAILGKIPLEIPGTYPADLRWPGADRRCGSGMHAVIAGRDVLSRIPASGFRRIRAVAVELLRHCCRRRSALHRYSSLLVARVSPHVDLYSVRSQNR